MVVKLPVTAALSNCRLAASSDNFSIQKVRSFKLCLLGETATA